MINQKGFSTVIFVFGIFIMSGLIIGGSIFAKNNIFVNPQPKPTQSTSSSNNNQSDQPKTSQSTKIEDIVPLEDKVVMELIQAMKKSDWQTIYRMTSSTFTADLTVKAFVSNMQAQEKETGKVEAVEVLSKPEVIISPQSIKSFKVKTKVTYNKNGIKTTETFIDNYIWEENQWKFWFSDPSK